MTDPTTSGRIPKAWGVVESYRNHAKLLREPPQETIEAILDAMGADGPKPPTHLGPIVVTAGKAHPISGAFQIRTELGETISGTGTIPTDLPLGYHRIETANGTERGLIVGPPECMSTDDLHEWGWALQLYAARSTSSWGMGDIGDLRDFTSMARAQGAGVVLVNPLHASLPGLPQESSPYFSSSREFRNPIYLRIEDIPGAFDADVNVTELAAQGRALNADRRIDRDAVWRLKADALDKIWKNTKPAPEFEQYCVEQGEPLERYAVFCALVEKHGRPWTQWPAELRHPKTASVQEFANSHRDRVLFHQWLQWLVHEQIDAIEGHVLLNDLAIGVDPAGADAWLWQDALALDVRVGTPPEQFNTQGQDWGLPPFNPWKLKELEYEPFIRILRGGFTHAAGLRIDHVMGLFRLFWIPSSVSAAQGTYVQYPWREMLTILALESVRADAYVVGEDLGSVEPYMRKELQHRNILSYRLLWFESKPPPKFPRKALAAITTHDLPTVSGLFTDEDLAIQHRNGTHPNEIATKKMKDRVGRWLHLPSGAPIEDVSAAAHKLLGSAPSSLVTATVEDALGITERPNYPGTTDQYPNWSVALPVPLDQLAENPGIQRTVKALADARSEALHSSEDSH